MIWEVLGPYLNFYAASPMQEWNLPYLLDEAELIGGVSGFSENTFCDFMTLYTCNKYATYE